MHKTIVIGLMLYSCNCLAETTLIDSELRVCRNLSDMVAEKIEKKKGTPEQIDEYINTLGDSFSNPKTGELYVDVARQYYYGGSRKWLKAYEYCTDNLHSYR
jgi:hypothetical protein